MTGMCFVQPEGPFRGRWTVEPGEIIREIGSSPVRRVALDLDDEMERATRGADWFTSEEMRAVLLAEVGLTVQEADGLIEP